MADYTLQEATLTVPDIFKDRTMNLFTLSDNGASEFTFVVSRASAKRHEKIEEIATRIVQELETTVPYFRLASSKAKTVDGQSAIELFYQFENDNITVFQYQTIILLDELPAGKKIVCYIGTCPGEFNDYYIRQYEDIINSITFHNKKADPAVQMLYADNQNVFFALDADTRVLEVFKGIQTLYQHLSIKSVREGQYFLYAQDGSPLQIAPVPDSEPVRYALWTTSAGHMNPLEQQLNVCRGVKGPAELDSLEKIRQFLVNKRTV